MPDRDNEPLADDQVGLAILDFPAGQLGSPQHDEQRVVVDIELGPLVCLICVLDHQLMKAELGFEDAEQRLIRLVQTEPDDAAIAAGQGADFLHRDIALPLPFPIEGTGDNPPRLRHICGFGAGEVEHLSQRR